MNESFIEKLEAVQYNAILVVTGVIRGTSQEHLYHELCLVSLSDRKWSRKLLFFHNIVKGFSHSYLQEILVMSHTIRSYLNQLKHNNLGQILMLLRVFTFRIAPWKGSK